MSCRQPDDEEYMHRRIAEHGSAIRWLSVAVIMLGTGLLCSNAGNIMWTLDRIF